LFALAQPAPDLVPPGNGSGPSIAAELRKLGELRDAGC
jgi:hypothetical protein